MEDSKRVILVVDDEEIIRDVSKGMLESLGFIVYVAEGGQEAVALCEEKKDKFDLVMLDMNMPDMSGEETFYCLRRISPKLKVLISSGQALDSTVRAMISSGCRGFLEKPFTLAGLSEKVNKVLDSE